VNDTARRLGVADDAPSALDGDPLCDVAADFTPIGI
jgi:hypothetical protein